MSATSATVLAFPTARCEYASAPESAKLLKSALRAAFPATTFSVKLSRGTGYGYCHVRWTDGPTVKLVKAITDSFEGSTFDGMQDMEEYKHQLLPDGRQTGLRGVSTDRSVSPAFARRLVAQIATYYGVDAANIPAVVETGGTFVTWSLSDQNARFGGEYWTDLIHRAAGDRQRFNREG